MTVIRALARKLAAGGLRPSGALRWSCSAPLRTRDDGLARTLAAGGLRPSGALRWSCSAPLRTRAERRRILSRRTRDLGGLAAYTPGVTPYKTPEYHPAFEEYCETIFELREDDVDVIQARVAE